MGKCKDTCKWTKVRFSSSFLYCNRVPVAAADYLILRALRESNGIAVTVTDEEMLQSCIEMGRETGTILPLHYNI